MNDQPTFALTLAEFSVRSAAELYTPGVNLAYSPASLSQILGTVLEGSDGLTQQEIIRSILYPDFEKNPNPPNYPHYNNETAVFAKKFLAELGRGHLSQKGVNGANFFYTNQSVELRDDFKKNVEEKYKTPFRQFNFNDYKNRVEAARIINEDLEKTETGNATIHGFIEEGDISSESMAVIANTIHFRGAWSAPFDRDHTLKTGFFYRPGEKRVYTPMMRQEGRFAVGTCAKTQARLLQLPYYSADPKAKTSMIIIRPKDGKIKEYLANFTLFDLRHALDGASSNSNTEIMMPPFKIESSHKGLEKMLKSMGIKSIFGDDQNQKRPDFSRMTPNKNMVVSKIFQKAVVECVEEGVKTDADAAVHEKNADFSLEKGEPEKFIADRPFIFLIITKYPESPMVLLDNILFVGVLENPVNARVERVN